MKTRKFIFATAVFLLSTLCANAYSSKPDFSVSIYSITGSLLYSTAKPAGEKQIFLGNMHNNIGIVKGSSGWVKKVYFK